MSTSPTFYLRLFGSPSVQGEGGILLTGRVTQRHRLALLALLARAPGERLTRDKLIAYLWPGSDAERGRNLLNISTYVLRMSLGDDAILSTGDELLMNPEVVRSDVAEFEAALASGDYTRAVSLYKAPFLEGFFLSDAPEFEQWADREYQGLAGCYRKALDTLAEAAESQSDFSRAAEWWEARAVDDRYNSHVAVRLMRALEAAGNRAGALQHAAAHQQLLQADLGTTAPEVAALAERLRITPS